MPRQPRADWEDPKRRLWFALVGGLAFAAMGTAANYVFEQKLVWEGLIGGLVFALVSYFVPYFVSHPRFLRLPLPHDTFVKVAFVFISVIIVSAIVALLISR